jgi:glycosyltransferase involved in cell wall biosynthesis
VRSGRHVWPSIEAASAWEPVPDRSADGWDSFVKPDITAVVPTHNRRDLLRLTLRAILGQRDVDLEVIVVDDGSTDDTAAVVAGLGDRRVRLIRHDRPTGVSTARNHGAEEATAAWLAFCDDDDLWAPDKLARQLQAAARAGRTWSYGGAVRIDRALRIMGGTPPPPPARLAKRLPSWNLMPGGSSNAIVRAAVFRDAGCWDPALVNLADWDLWIRLVRLGLPACVMEPLVGYRIHPSNSSANTALILAEARRMDGRYGDRTDYGELHHYLAWVCLRSGRRRPGEEHFARAAAHGQVPGVARSLAGIVRGRVRRRFGLPRPDADRAWYNRAEAWLAELREPVGSS